MKPEKDYSPFLQRISESVLNLPTLPTIHARLLELVDHPKATAQLLGSLIREDQSLTARLLKMCNSAYYGLSVEVESVDRAIVLLGFDTVREMSLGISVIDQFDKVGGRGSLDLTKFWEHSAMVALSAKNIAKEWFPEVAKEAFLAGLLHDVGKLILIQYLEGEFGDILIEADLGDDFLFEIEMKKLGTHHGEIGFWLARKWNFPKAVSECIRFHHYPEKSSKHSKLVAVVCLANLITQEMKLGFGGNVRSIKHSESISEFLTEYFPLSEEGFFQKLGEGVQREIDSSESLLNSLLR